MGDFHFLFAQKIPTHSALLSQAASEWTEEHKQNKQFLCNSFISSYEAYTL